MEGAGSILTAEFLAVSDCQVLDGGKPQYVAHRGGGVAAIARAELRLHDVRVERCQSNHGGGIAFDSSSGMLADCRIIDCALNPATSTTSQTGVGGAGIYMFARSVVTWFGGSIENCSRANNGAGWAAADSSFHMTDAVISGCTALRAGGAGLVTSRFYGDPNAMSTANLSNISVLSWCARTARATV